MCTYQLLSQLLTQSQSWFFHTPAHSPCPLKIIFKQVPDAYNSFKSFNLGL